VKRLPDEADLGEAMGEASEGHRLRDLRKRT
jgi:hypothetical protein